MSWEDKKSIKRIFNTFKRLKDKIFDEDIEALKQLNESFEMNSKAYVEDNLLYAKLLCVILRLNVEYYSDMKVAIKKTSQDLKYPIDMHLQFLTMSLNDVEKRNYFKSIGIDFENRFKDESEIINANQKEIIEKLKKSWSIENVSKSFYSSANDFLKDVENYK